RTPRARRRACRRRSLRRGSSRASYGVKRQGLAILREPHCGSHAHLPAVAAIGEEALAFAIGAEAAAVDAVHARPFEARACDGVEVQQPVTGTRAAKSGVRSA